MILALILIACSLNNLAPILFKSYSDEAFIVNVSFSRIFGSIISRYSIAGAIEFPFSSNPIPVVLGIVVVVVEIVVVVGGIVVVVVIS